MDTDMIDELLPELDETLWQEAVLVPGPKQHALTWTQGIASNPWRNRRGKRLNPK